MITIDLERLRSDRTLQAGAADNRDEGATMARYVVLFDWTDQGVRSFSESVDRYEAASRQLEREGLRFTDVYWTLGTHDLVAVAEVDNDETLAAALLRVAAQGNVRTTTLRAFTADEMRGIISAAT